MPDHPAAPPTGPQTGHSLIQTYLRTLDHSPGVYRMLNAKNEVLYVGKARDLKARVGNYARLSGHSERIARMISETAGMKFLTTRTETEALLLEQNLIKQLKPRYNVLLRDDKSFPYILVTTGHPFPKLTKHRGARTIEGSYFGPFASGKAVEQTLHQLQRVFLLRTCTDAVFQGRTRPCLLYQIKRCCGPCTQQTGPEAYGQLVEDALRFLEGKSSDIQANLAKAMNEAAAQLEYERAAALRDRIKALTQIQGSQGINPRHVEQADIVAVHTEGGAACVQVFFIRNHQNWGNHDFYPQTGVGADEAEILEAFLAQFYTGKIAPKLILLSHPPENADLVAQLLSERAGYKITLTTPQRGEKAQLVENALRNARESLARKRAESAGQHKLRSALAEKFGLPRPPKRIEVYDNSHLQGTNAVGGMIVMGEEGFIKSHYRKFNMTGAAGAAGNDFGMMREMITRRFERLLHEDPARQSDLWPDLLFIDGGAGQVSAVMEVLTSLGLGDMPMIGVAKGVDRDHGKEKFYRPNRPPFALPMNDPVLYFIQRLRDEAHRWAIGAHRSKRAKAVSTTPLDTIEGIGAVRKRALLAHFGSAKAVSGADIADLKAVKGISGAMAQTIFNFFHSGN